ncbi:MAG: hypothetical protein K9L86_01300 [Candidatus Omnitrophica bacterium]|nr:hypothetical protein [Candidatus Omnitrophota bacterium]
MKKVIVATTIQNPTEAIEKFDSLKEWTLIVVGDLKTPESYKLENGMYFSPQEQEKYDQELSDLIGWNTHARRNFGHLLAKDMGADVIACVDDDNIPYNTWGKDIFIGKVVEANYYESDLEAFDPVGATNHPYLWHRGFPIQLINKRDYSKKIKKKIKVDIQADFWNGDPDIDAICRMIYKSEVSFEEQYFPIASNKPSPFNSQNTFIAKDVLPYCFFLPHITPLGRQSDIGISYHLASLGYNVIYCKPSVYQARNTHNLTIDMEDEFKGYMSNIDIVRAIGNGTYKKEDFWPEQTCAAYEVYQRRFK